MNYRVRKYILNFEYLLMFISSVASVTTDTLNNGWDAPKMPSGWREVGGSQHVCPTDLRATCVHGWVLAIACDQASRKWSQVPRTFLYAHQAGRSSDIVRALKTLDRDSQLRFEASPCIEKAASLAVISTCESLRAYQTFPITIVPFGMK